LLSNFGSGLITGYAKGEKMGGMFSGGFLNAVAGLGTTPLGDALFSFIPNLPGSDSLSREMQSALTISKESFKQTSGEIYGDKLNELLRGRKIHIP